MTAGIAPRSGQRYNRARYLAWTALIAVVGGGLAVLAALSRSPGAIGLIQLAAVVPSAIVASKRLHDLNTSAWYLLLGLIPLVNIGLGLVLVFARGTRGPNKYGPDPLAPRASAGAAVPGSPSGGSAGGEPRYEDLMKEAASLGLATEGWPSKEKLIEMIEKAKEQ